MDNAILEEYHSGYYTSDYDSLEVEVEIYA
jgi:hypothetical protein